MGAHCTVARTARFARAGLQRFGTRAVPLEPVEEALVVDIGFQTDR